MRVYIEVLENIRHLATLSKVSEFINDLVPNGAATDGTRWINNIYVNRNNNENKINR